MKALDKAWYAALDLHNEAVNMRVNSPADLREQDAKLKLAKLIRREVSKLGLDLIEPRATVASDARRAA